MITKSLYPFSCRFRWTSSNFHSLRLLLVGLFFCGLFYTTGWDRHFPLIYCFKIGKWWHFLFLFYRRFLYACRSRARGLCYNALWKITHFEKLFQSALNLGLSQRTLKKNIFFQNALIWGILTHFEKKIENHILHSWLYFSFFFLISNIIVSISSMCYWRFYRLFAHLSWAWRITAGIKVVLHRVNQTNFCRLDSVRVFLTDVL